MKKYILILLLFSICSIRSYSQYHVTFVGQTYQTVTLRCIGYGSKADKAARNAELSAIQCLLFVGIPDSQYSTPLISENRLVFEERHKDFFASFYEDGYKAFISSTMIVTPFKKNNLKEKCLTLDICVNVLQLRTFLESSHIIRKFGL